ncbi:hypothetical protein KDA_07060 [Dictyobacter alpinus]|uniref:Response regulatory domain-containing protein n=1 Tax=Dictyobacter alpinus TaxID=2014873 RepID=A0A402B1K0_9CHLR|nr:response regulator transcription factor [Dictyobacter alpinus]GCE25222.1 hypothetical protein KDA_07060 [Dictyobacter alpinus]
MATHIIALEKDLFFSVKIRDTLSHHDTEVLIARNLSAFEKGLQTPHKPALAIVNIAIQGVDWEEAIRAAVVQQIPVLAFGSHMDLEARKRALEAGAQKVVANSKFTSDMPGLIKRLLETPADQSIQNEEDNEAFSE